MKIKSKIAKRYREDGFKGVVARIPGFVWEESKPLIIRMSGRLIDVKDNQVNYHNLRIDFSNLRLRKNKRLNSTKFEIRNFAYHPTNKEVSFIFMRTTRSFIPREL